MGEPSALYIGLCVGDCKSFGVSPIDLRWSGFMIVVSAPVSGSKESVPVPLLCVISVKKKLNLNFLFIYGHIFEGWDCSSD